MTISLMAQGDTLSITLSPFTKKEGQSEILYVAVLIKSNVRDSVEIDDSRSWINCVNAIGVKLVSQTLVDDCYREVDKSDCHPTYSPDGNYFGEAVKKIKLAGFAEYSYIVRVFYVLTVEETGLKRTLKNFNPYRFKLELPYKVNDKWSYATSKNWAYYAYPR